MLRGAIPYMIENHAQRRHLGRMARISNQRAVIDRKAVADQLYRLADDEGISAKTQGKVLAIFKSALTRGREEIRRRFEDEQGLGSDCVRSQAFLADQLVRLIHDFAAEHVYPLSNPTTAEQLSIAAVGGFGRNEMAPFSDIDLLFLLPYKQTPRGEQLVEYMLYMLWDMGLKVGHATRSIDDCVRLARADLTICTSMIEARWIWGDKALYAKFRARFQKELVATSGPEFVEKKLAERDNRHAQMGDSRYVLEPNVKEGKGGLRDLQTLFWIAKYLYRVEETADLVAKGVLTKGDVKLFDRAQQFLWTVRCHLHFIAGRPEERLTFDVQTTISKRMAYRNRPGVQGVERFMKHYFLIAKSVGDLTRILCAVLEEQHKKRKSLLGMPHFGFRKRATEGFIVDRDRLNVGGKQAFKEKPIRLLQLFHEAQRLEIDVHPEALRLVTQNLRLIDDDLRADPEANRLFIEMMTSSLNPQQTLSRLNEAGVFGLFVPDFGRVVAQMQYDMYHVYTVDEHTIRAIGILSRIESGALRDEHPVSSDVIQEVLARRALYVALLLHDIAKGRGGDHSELGAEIALELGPRFGLDAWETETVSWLVKNHLAMSHTAFKRDIDDAKTVSDFVAVVQSPERLRLLLLLTVADIRAVGPDVWNSWKAALLRELYFRTLEVMIGGVPAEHKAARVNRAKEDLREKLCDWTPEAVEEFVSKGYPGYWLGFDADVHEYHARTVSKATELGLALHIDTRVVAARGVTEILIYTADHPGLFTRISGAMALSDASIVDARITTFSDGMALDTFSIQDAFGGAFRDPGRLKRLQRNIEDSLAGKIIPRRELVARGKRLLARRTGVFLVSPGVLIDNKASTTHTVLEVNGCDRPGYLHDVTAALTDLGLQIGTAQISTYGERAVDVFYVKDIFGLKIENEDRLARIRKTILEAISPSSSSEAKDSVAAE
jgi:[protein-PII] uridylyltransferase